VTNDPRFWSGCAAVSMAVGLVLNLAIEEGTLIALPAFLLGAGCATLGWLKERAAKKE
jgi:hypothetical protein